MKTTPQTPKVKAGKKCPTVNKSAMRKNILKVIATASGDDGVTLYAIKKYLDSKVAGLSKTSEFKVMIKKLAADEVISGQNGRYRAIAAKSPKKSVKNLALKAQKPEKKLVRKPAAQGVGSGRRASK